jgi:hypothetical protein
MTLSVSKIFLHFQFSVLYNRACNGSFVHFLPYMASVLNICLSHTVRQHLIQKNHVGHCRKSEKSLQVINFYGGRTNIAGQKVSAKRQLKKSAARKEKEI